MNARLYQVFSALRGVEPKARYLACLMLERGLVGDGVVWDGGVAKLAGAVGYSKAGVSQGLKVLVSHGAFTKGKKKTLGRPVETYRLSIKFKALEDLALSESVCLRVLNSEAEVFSQLSVAERCLLAQLWVGLGGANGHAFAAVGVGSSALIRVGVATLAEDVGLHESTVRRLLSMLVDNGFIYCVNTKFPRGKVLSKANVYFLLGPSMIKDFPVKHIEKVNLSGVLGWFAGHADSGNECNDLVRVGGLNFQGVSHKLAALKVIELENVAVRHYVFTCLCVALSSKSFVMELELTRFIEGLLREILEVDDLGSAQLSEKGRDVNDLLLLFVTRVARHLQREIMSLFSMMGVLKDGLPVGLSCYPVGRMGTVQLQVNAVFQG